MGFSRMNEGDAYDARARALFPWHRAFEFLSLDCWLPFWRDMGLSLDDERQILVRDAARIAYRALHGRDRTCYSGDYRPETGEQVLAAFTETVETKLGKSVAEGLRTWVQRSCGRPDLGGMLNAQWWSALVDLCQERRRGEFVIAIARDRLAMLVSLIRTELMDPFETMSAKTRQVQTVSAWDRKIRKARFDPRRPDRDEVPCRAKVSLAVSGLRFSRLWRRITEICTEDEIAALQMWYRLKARHSLKQHSKLDRLPLVD